MNRIGVSALPDYPILHQKVNGKPLTYLDNAATTQKPEEVIQTLSAYYRQINSNIHRGVHHLSQLATTAYEEARETVRDFIHAKESCEIIFTRGTTESINMIASSFGRSHIQKGDRIALSLMEHHSNLVPWQEAALRHHAQLAYIPFDTQGNLSMVAAQEVLSAKPKLLTITHISNVLGTINPIQELIHLAHSYGVPVLVDGAQAVAHLSINVQELDCDFYCFSGHKMYGPMGIGVLYGKREALEAIPPYQFGGEMIKEVHKDRSTYNDLPFKFEAGTPPVAEAIALAQSIRYLQQIKLSHIAMHEQSLTLATTQALQQMGGVDIYGQSQHKTGVISFNLHGAHHYDVGVLLDQMGIAVRTGHHCAQPLMEELNISGTVRASFALYNTQEDVDRLLQGLAKVQKILK